MRCFEVFELLHQQIKVRIADLRIVEYVITVLVITNLIAKRLDITRGTCGFLRHGTEQDINEASSWLIRASGEARA